MTKELLPGLGSGALREALEKAMDALERIRASQRIVGVLVVQDMEGAIRSGRAALSLSSPIEHEPHSADFLRGYNEGCKDGAENTLREIIARNAERKAQASSEIREALEDLLINEVCSCRKYLDGKPCPRCKVAIDNARELVYPAPSRQGAGGK